MKLVYLATPYSHDDPKVVEERVKQNVEVLKHTFEKHKGVNMISPVVQSHSLVVDHGFNGTWDFWEDIDRHLISKCDELWMLLLDGWQDSVGMAAEVEYAKELGLPIGRINPYQWGLTGYKQIV